MHHPVLQSWLELQSRSLGKPRAACVRVLPRCLPWAQTQQATPTLSLDHSGDPDAWIASLENESVPSTALDDLLSLATTSRSLVVATPDDVNKHGAQLLRIAQPIEVQGQVCGAVAIELDGHGTAEQDKVVRLLQWGTAWLDLLLTHNSSDASGVPVAAPSSWHAELPSLLQCVSTAESVQHAKMSVVGFLAHRLGLEFVALATRQAGKIHVDAVSGRANLSAQSELAERLVDEVQQSLVCIESRHADPSYSVDAPLLQTVLLESGAIGAVLIDECSQDTVLIAEPRRDESPTQALVEALDISVQVLGPAIDLKRQQHQTLTDRSRQRLNQGRQMMSQASGLVRLGLIAVAMILVLLFLLAKIPYRVSGGARVEGALQRAVIAPFDGFVTQAHVKAGEQVEKNDLLAELDDADMRLRLRELQGTKSETSKEYRQALAVFDKSRAKILETQLEQASARINQIEQQLNRTQLRAPFDGTVVSGDLSRSLGKPVQRGEILFEVAPLNEYRVAITIKDIDVAHLKPQQTGALVLAALPSQELTISVDSIAQLPDDEQHPGEFRVQAQLAGDVSVLRPGMRGIAKVQTSERARWWVWTHSLTDWLRYQVWRWMP